MDPLGLHATCSQVFCFSRETAHKTNVPGMARKMVSKIECHVQVSHSVARPALAGIRFRVCADTAAFVVLFVEVQMGKAARTHQKMGGSAEQRLIMKVNASIVGSLQGPYVAALAARGLYALSSQTNSFAGDMGPSSTRERHTKNKHSLASFHGLPRSCTNDMANKLVDNNRTTRTD